MSRLYNDLAGELRRNVAYQTLYLPQPAGLVASDHHELYRLAAEFVGPNRPVTYLEFGVAGGQSFSDIKALFSNPNAMFIGFDSFVGLPEDWMGLKAGTFSSDGRYPTVADGRAQFVNGWFQNTLHASLQLFLSRSDGPFLVHYDCDLYSSTLFLLTSLWPHIQEYYFLMDDFMVDDLVALYDFSLAYPVDIEFLARREGGLPHSVLGRMRRKELAI